MPPVGLTCSITYLRLICVAQGEDARQYLVASQPMKLPAAGHYKLHRRWPRLERGQHSCLYDFKFYSFYVDEFKFC
jgi:hypothetical protein